jgi:signal transduction histidine kinase
MATTPTKCFKLNFFRLKQFASADFARWLTGVLALAVVYFGAARLGSMVALPIPPGNMTAVWLPSPIAWTAMLLVGYRYCLGIWLGDALFTLTSLAGTTDAIAKVVIAGTWGAAGSTLEAVLGAFLIQQFLGTRYPFNRSKDVFRFVLVAMLCPAVNAANGTGIFCLVGLSSWENFGSLWLTFWIGNTVSVLVFTPALLTALLTWKHYSNIRFRLWQFIEAAFLLLLLLGVVKTAFGFNYPVEYLLFPCLIWAAFRFQQLGATVGIVLISGIAIWGTVQGRGSFLRESLNESLLLLQTFMGAVAVTTLVLASVLEERKRSEVALEEANEQLETKVEQRTFALKQANEQLTIEILERKQAEEALRQSEEEKTRLIISLQDQAATLESTLQNLQKTQAQLIQTEKMSSLGQLVAGVAHEINNPVNFIHGNLAHADSYIQDLLALIKLYQQGYTNTHSEVKQLTQAVELDFLMEDLPKLLSSMKLGVDRIRQIVLTLRNFSRLDEAEMKPVNIHEGIDSTLLILQNRLKTEAGQPNIQIIKHYGALPQVECYASQLNQVFMNIINNSIDALCQRNRERASEAREHPSTITISTQTLDSNWVNICIKDNGTGMTAAVQEKLFDPFFTTKPVGQGTGLGLSISHQIVVEKHGGRLKCTSAPGQGTAFQIEIPVWQP